MVVVVGGGDGGRLGVDDGTCGGVAAVVVGARGSGVCGDCVCQGEGGDGHVGVSAGNGGTADNGGNGDPLSKSFGVTNGNTSHSSLSLRFSSHSSTRISKVR